MWLLMWLAVTIFPAAYLPTNLKRVMRHPFLWGVTLWAVAHLLTNGDLASLLLFGSFAAYTLFDMWSANRRGAEASKIHYPIWRDGVLVAIGTAAHLRHWCPLRKPLGVIIHSTASLDAGDLYLGLHRFNALA